MPRSPSDGEGERGPTTSGGSVESTSVGGDSSGRSENSGDVGDSGETVKSDGSKGDGVSKGGEESERGRTFQKWIWLGVSALVAVTIGFTALGNKRKVSAEKSGEDLRAEYALPYTVRAVKSAIFGEKREAKKRKSRELLLRGAEIWTAAGRIIHEGEILIRDGKIAEVGKKIDAPTAEVIDVREKFVTPGLIDAHSHIGVYPSVAMRGVSDGNEWVKPITGYAWAEKAVWPQDPAIPRALAGGVTTILVLPGSANLVGGRGAVIKLRPARSVQEMKFPGAPVNVKMACGENPKRVHRSIATRMGNYAGFRRAFQRALEYKRRWERYRERLKLWRERRAKFFEKCKKKSNKAATQPARRGNTSPTSRPAGSSSCGEFKELKPTPPRRDFNLETLVGILEGRFLAQVHCYRADDMMWMIKLADEFGFKIRAFHHALEAYKIRDILAKKGIAVATWADWWGFKIEAYDGIQENAALVEEAGGRAVIHSDSARVVQRLLQEAAKVFYRARRAGIPLSYDKVLRWVTANPAWLMGIHRYTGTIEEGKAADLVVWDRFPLSIYAKPVLVFIDGQIVYDRKFDIRPTDFDLGLNLPF